MSQVGFPQCILLTPNPPAHDHWLARDFPEVGAQPGYRYIRTSVYDNRAVLGDDYIRELEAAYPPGTVLRRRFIDGRRGLSATGDPVYKGYFNRGLHERDEVPLNPDVALLEAWDFGHHHPCVVYGQFVPQGGFHVLGGVIGESMFLEDFVPMVLQIRRQWFPSPLEIKSTGDPAGTARSSQGTNRSAADVLQANGISLQTVVGANHPDKRNTAIQALAGYMRRLTPSGPAFQITSRFLIIGKDYQRSMAVLVDGLEAGYVWNERATSQGGSSTRMPKKDGYYDHAQNDLEYLMLQFGPSVIEKKRKPTREQQHGFAPFSHDGPAGWMGG